MVLAGRALICLSVSLLFLAYSNFAPTALGSALISDYVKNHFVREIAFGVTLAAFVIVRTLTATCKPDVLQVALLGSIVVLPFWIAAALGWSTGGLEEVWGEKIRLASAYVLHISQVAVFYCGVAILTYALPSRPEAQAD